ncbi:hypothetical protein L210DRAFT_3410298 [Boletus edulis BED1]|uniref:Uncharacterized protein n=1 Tax=Boletus edulis BED1 TaxID=1328754 RepID=A0AAD4BM90_BOLED|nr:hypothetical protein L210DRAFT_3410298 [Boletus edulis BED1]
MKNPDIFLTLDALEDRLKSADRRNADYTALKEAQDADPPRTARPIELWDPDGTFASMPARLIPTNKPYSDDAQLQRWMDVVKNLGGKPPAHINPAYARFLLKPSETLKNTIKLYFTPANPPVFGIDTTRLKAIINANQAKFGDWPQREVIEFTTARDKGLKLIGRNFLQFYFTWMEVDHYKELWKQFGVSELLHAFPAEGDVAPDIYDKVDKRLKKGKQLVDGLEITVTWGKIQAARGNREGSTATIMGESATKVAADLWHEDSITSGMGNSKVEWLHRAACAFGGLNEQVSLKTSNDPNNLVFGTWECNTDMIRAENMVTELTKLDDMMPDSGYKGKLTTNNKTAGTVSRIGLEKTNTTATIPRWVGEKNYSWLSLSLGYKYQMMATESPLRQGFAQEIYFDPWSLYVPLGIEPRLDTMILNDLKSGDATADVVAHKIKKRSLASNMGDPLPNLPLPEYSSDAYPTLAWNAAIKGLPSLELPDIVIKYPMIASGPLADDDVPTDESIAHRTSRSRRSIPLGTPVPQNGFVLQGEVDVFGTAVVGNLEKWMGPPPEDVVVGIDPPSIERVVVPGDFHMSMLIPLLRGTPFDDIIFRNVAIYHQNYAFDKTKSIGWHFNADWVIDSSCGLLYDILTKALQVNKPILSIHASFGEQQRWSAPLSLHSFILEGVFPDLSISPVSGLTLTSIGVRLLGIRGFSFTPEPHSTLSFGFGIFGTMKLNVPGSVVPLDLDYEMGLTGRTVNLGAEISGSIWEDALGVKGLLLEDVVFGTTFSTTSPWKSFSFDVSATFSYMSSQAYLRGSYAAGGHFSLTAELDNFGTDEISDLFFAIFSDSLTLPDFDVHVGSAILSIVSGQGLTISLLDVNVAGYTAASIEVALSPSGASLSGALSSSTITFGDVELRDALIKLSFWITGKKKNVEFILGGTLGVDFLDLTVGAIVHLYPGEGGVEWAVVAVLNAPSRPFALSDVVPAVQDSFVDFSLRNAVFIAASKDDPLVGQSFPGYPVRKGVQVFGVIDRIPALNDLLHADVKGLVLNAGWSKASGFSLFVSLPAESTINLGNGMKTTPIALGIRTNPIELAVMAGVIVPVKDSTPLDFSFVLAANAIGASASAQMEGWWVKPFGIDNLKIGPEVTLSIEIIYAQFVSTGTPSGFGVSGGLMIGSIEAFLAMNVSEDPKRQMLFGELKKLDISDVVTLAGTLVQQDIPKIPDSLLKFEELKMYICPFGVVLGKTSYPQGFSFKADLLLFEKRANIECTIDKAQKSVDIIGGIDNFELGPLSVHGSKGPRAELECHIGVSKQQLIVDGVVTLFDTKTQTYINIQFLPEPIFKFYSLLQFANIFMFKLDAELLGSIHDRLSDADFSLYAELENDILDYIAQQIIEQFEAAKVAATEGLEVAQEKVSEAQKLWKDAIADAEKRVENAQKEWESYERNIRSSSQPIVDNYLSEISRLQGEVDKARQDYNNALEAAQRAVNQANQDRGAALAAAQRDVGNAKQDIDRAIDGAQRDLDYAEADLSKAFGDAKRGIDSAQQEVWSLQNQIDDIKRTIDDYDQAPWYEFWKKAAIAGLWVAVGTLEASKAIASGALDVARAILTGSEYLSKEAAVDAARLALEGARSTGKAALSAAQEALLAADETSKVAVDAAEATLQGVQKGVEFVAFQGAIEALEVFKKANKAAYEAAMAAIEGLMDSAAFIAFNAAKAGLEVAKGSTKVLDAAKEALSLAEKASQVALSILQDVVKFGAKALNINTIILSGTFRGILGIGGGNARPLSAVIKGYIVGQWFDIRAEFDVREPVEFITAIFKQ